ncbi:MAG TPA: hypothetical protein VG796_12185 [Verrucomicrobiales bacterium]|nr:hypothetical protein [Verrucomicrobiales bacterium]
MNTYHLKPKGDKWELTENGKEKPIAAFSDELTAEGASIDYAKTQRGTLKIFRDDETVKLILKCDPITPPAPSPAGGPPVAI